MRFDSIFYALLLFLAAGMGLVLGVIAWQNHRGKRTNQTFAGLMLAMSFWSFFQGLELVVADPGVKLLLVNLQYVGILATVALWFLFAVAFSGRDDLITLKTLLLLAVEPVLLLILLGTNAYHHLFRERVWLDFANGRSMLQADYGIAFWTHAIYSYTLLLVGTILVTRSVMHLSRLYRRQLIIILVSIMVPWLANLLYLMGITAVDFTALGFTVTGLALAWGLLRLHLLNVVPIARTAVFESLSDAIITLDDQGRIVDMNPATCTLFALDGEAEIGLPLHAVLPKLPALALQPDKTGPQHVEITWDIDAAPKIYDLQISPIMTSQKMVGGWVIVIRDVTARKQTEEAEREQRILAEALRDAAAALNNTLDVDEVLARILEDVGRVLPHDTANVMLLRGNIAHFVGYRGYSGQSLEKVHKIWPIKETPNLQQMVDTGQPIVISDVSQDSGWVDTPATRWICSYVGAPIQREGKVIGFINLDSATPNTYRAEHAERLLTFANQAAIALGNAQLFAELAERNTELDAFARTIAHDLKSPLGLIKGYAELLADYDLPVAGRAQLDIIQATVWRMEEMIEQLLLMAQLRDAAQTAVSVEVLPLLYAVISRFTNAIEAQKIVVQIDNQDLPPLLGHAPWLEEVFANLVSNAIKYIGSENPEPLIRIRGRLEGGLARYEIIDNGLGIEPADQEKLFDMFTRFHREEASGTGLGLSIVKRIVQKMGGEIGVESEPGRGSTFWFVLPTGLP